MKEYSIMIPSNRPELAREAKENLKYIQDIFIVDGSDMPSFSKLINLCILKCPTEIVIICNDKARPMPIHMDKMLNLINKGYGMVGLFRYGFFGFKKDIIRKVGFFDERFLGGGHEDIDYNFRLMEAKISNYQSEEVPYIKKESTWKYTDSNSIAKKHFYNKWEFNNGAISLKRTLPQNLKRKLKEEDYDYDIGYYLDSNFLPISETVFFGQYSWRK